MLLAKLRVRAAYPLVVSLTNLECTRMQALLGSWVRIAPFSLLLFSFPACCRCRNEAVAESALPKAATLAGDWQRAYDPAERALPTIGNFRGGALTYHAPDGSAIRSVNFYAND